jgi:hypothetical protein
MDAAKNLNQTALCIRTSFELSLGRKQSSEQLQRKLAGATFLQTNENTNT